MDEAQLEVSEDLVVFKQFETEKEAEEFNEEGKIWSDVGENEKGIFRAYSLPGESACRAVREASEYYKLNVELTAGYQVGKNWKECH